MVEPSGGVAPVLLLTEVPKGGESRRAVVVVMVMGMGDFKGGDGLEGEGGDERSSCFAWSIQCIGRPTGAWREGRVRERLGEGEKEAWVVR